MVKSMSKIIKKWEGGEEFATRENLTYWWRTGRHICRYITDDSMGEDNKGRCIICGKRKNENNN